MKRTATASVKPCTLLLVRHAHTELAGRFCGLIDPPLSAQGLSQLAGLNERLKDQPITHIFSSDLQRARQTAESIAERHGLQVQYLETLHELAFGSWEGLDWDEVMARDPEYARRWLDLYPSVPAPGGEYFESFRQRVQSAMTAVAAQMQGRCAAVVTHAGVIGTFLSCIAGQDDGAFAMTPCDYASWWEVGWDGRQWHSPVAASTPPTSTPAATSVEYRE